MAVGDLEGKIGEVNGQLRTLAPIMEAMGQKVSAIAERLAGQAQSLKSAWHEIEELKKNQKDGSGRLWQVFLMVATAIVSALVTLGVTALAKRGT